MVLTGESGSVLSLCILVVIYGDKKRYLKITSNNKKDDKKDAHIFFYQESGCLFSFYVSENKKRMPMNISGTKLSVLLIYLILIN